MIGLENHIKSLIGILNRTMNVDKREQRNTELGDFLTFYEERSSEFLWKPFNPEFGMPEEALDFADDVVHINDADSTGFEDDDNNAPEPAKEP